MKWRRKFVLMCMTHPSFRIVLITDFVYSLSYKLWKTNVKVNLPENGFL